MQHKPFKKLLLGAAISLSPAFANALIIDFDYSYDTSGLFTTVNSEYVSTLEYAASFFENRITDTLTSINPVADFNTWTTSVFNPSGGADINETDLTINTDTITIFVGAKNITSLAYGGPGGYSASGTQEFFNSLVRGQQNTSGSTATDFGTWGGAISFDSNANWYTGSNVEGLGSNQNDFLSVALHEIGHVLGVGTSDSWNYNNSLPLTDDGAHIAEGFESFISGTNLPQEAAFDPTLTVGTRKLLTDIDFQALEQVGYVIAPIPEMETWAMMIAGLSLFGYTFRKRQAAGVNNNTALS